MPPLTPLQQSLRDQHAPASHLDRLADLAQWAAQDTRVHAIALVGSYAKRRGDRLSDLDLVAFAAPGDVEAVRDAALARLQRQPVLQVFGERSSPDSVFCKLVYLDFSSVEFHVFALDAGFGLKRPYEVVWDPGSILPARVVDGEPIAPEDFSLYDHGDAGLLWGLLDGIKWLSRGQFGLTHHHLLKLADAIRQHHGQHHGDHHIHHQRPTGAPAPNAHPQPDAPYFIALEQRRTRALVERDWPAIEALHAPGYQLITPAGEVLDRDAYFALLRAAPFYSAWEIGPVQLRLTPAMALLRYPARLHFPSGRAIDVQHTDSYEPTQSGWQAVWSQATALAPPKAPPH